MTWIPCWKIVVFVWRYVNNCLIFSKQERILAMASKNWDGNKNCVHLCRSRKEYINSHNVLIIEEFVVCYNKSGEDTYFLICQLANYTMVLELI